MENARDTGRAVVYFRAPNGWGPDDPNPFTSDGSYDASWSCFQVRNDHPDRHSWGRRPDGLICFSAGSRLSNLEQHVADFIRYETRHGRRVILSLPPGVDADALVLAAFDHTPDAPAIRSTDPRWLVHSTTAEAWQAITADACLKSLARLEAEGIPAPKTGFRELGEPPDYAEHIVLAGIDELGPEFVQASRQQRRFRSEPDAPYCPGLRLYFDAHSIIRSGLAVRDGVHLLKVRDALPLKPHLSAAVSVREIDPDGETTVWTPRLFVARANAWFQKHCAP